MHACLEKAPSPEAVMADELKAKIVAAGDEVRELKAEKKDAKDKARAARMRIGLIAPIDSDA